jgi:hypothetical protein
MQEQQESMGGMLGCDEMNSQLERAVKKVPKDWNIQDMQPVKLGKQGQIMQIGVYKGKLLPLWVYPPEVQEQRLKRVRAYLEKRALRAVVGGGASGTKLGGRL